MNNKEFIAELAKRTQATAKDTATMPGAFVDTLTALLEDEDTLVIQNFGAFEVRKKQERVVVNPATQQRMLVPPKLSVSFKPSAALKEKVQ